MAKRRNGKYSKELEQLKMLKSINNMLKSSDMENALLSNSAKESETMPDSMVDEMLGNLSAERERNKDIFDVEKITRNAMGGQASQPKHMTRSSTPRKAKPKRRRTVKKRPARIKGRGRRR